jgi:hypothetical protein
MVSIKGGTYQGMSRHGVFRQIGVVEQTYFPAHNLSNVQSLEFSQLGGRSGIVARSAIWQ